ncbi:cytochrome c oxidase assembly protein [Streptomyces galbus]|uniref:Cytochrome c oxidase assembly protein n=1 Tax=Streptomyces galbus TaxID=33898 RepID=A0ABX1IKG6_STRGB|nr:cytochrome c oxidase assembly protein [Streptomyces galbus]NKQ24788.1 cytochrome c oxidase assembly protein [Streptomyces galbus]
MTAGDAPFGPAAVLACALACAAYLSGALRLRSRGDAWPWPRDCAFTAGAAVLAWGLSGALPGGPFTGHALRHVGVGMAGPALLVVARPLTLTLRLLPPGGLRRGLLRVAHSPPAAWLLLPPVAAAVDVGSLWVLYRTGLAAAAHHHPWLDGALHLHMAAAGLLFGAAICQLDPVRRRRSTALRATTLLLAGTAHAVLAKTLYATGPPGTAFTAADLRAGAQVMYYGGDAVEVALALVLAAGWYTAAGRRLRRAGGAVRGRARRTPPACPEADGGRATGRLSRPWAPGYGRR